ncbi:MAG: hypothetical protein ACJAXB_002447, partial [Candidatus Endobugula sp.]
WEIIRDFTNIVFIFALLLIAFKMVLGQDDGGAKKTLVKTILIALTINFSLFFVYAIVDSSNLLAYTFYEKIEAPEVTFSAGEGSSAEVRTSPSLSLALLQKVNPQKLLKELEGDNDTERLILIFMVGAVNIAFLFLFLSMSLLFLGRTLGLMVLAILAPFALATLTLGPKAAGMSYVGWNKWFPQLISLAFMAPVFLFFLYLTTLFSKITDTMVVEDGAGIVTSIFRVALPMLTIFALVQLSKKVATKMAGELGGQINGYVQKAAGAAVGVAAIAATGGAAALAGGVGSIAGAGAKEGSSRAKFASGTKRFAKMAASSKLDISRIPGFKNTLGEGGNVLRDLSSKSSRQHLMDFNKKRRENPIVGNDTKKLDKRNEDKELKSAKDSADSARKDAEAKHAATVYQAQVKNAGTENDTDYKDALKAVTEAAKELTKAEKQFATKDRVYEQALRDPNASASDKSKAKIARDTAETNMEDKTVEASGKQSSLEATLGYQNKKVLDKAKEDMKESGDLAESESRQKSAKKFEGTSNAAIGTKIMDGINPKDAALKKAEKLLEKLEE